MKKEEEARKKAAEKRQRDAEKAKKKAQDSTLQAWGDWNASASTLSPNTQAYALF